MCKEDAIFASNTSSLSITEMGEVSGRPDRFVGVHFFNPVQMMKLVEVIKTDHTHPEVFDACKDWVGDINKIAVSCTDTPGFIVNRLLVPFLTQALLMVDRGDASIKDIDISMQVRGRGEERSDEWRRGVAYRIRGAPIEGGVWRELHETALESIILNEKLTHPTLHFSIVAARSGAPNGSPPPRRLHRPRHHQQHHHRLG